MAKMTEPPSAISQDEAQLPESLDKLPPYFQGMMRGYIDCMIAEGYIDPPDNPTKYNERVFDYIRARVSEIPEEHWMEVTRSVPRGFTVFAENEIQELLDHIIHLFTYWGYDLANKSRAKGHPVYLKDRREVIEDAFKNTEILSWGGKKYRLVCENGKYFITAKDDPLWKD